MKTLNQIVAQITDFADAHHQLQSVGVGTIAELQGEERDYPLLWVVIQPTDTDTAYLTNNIRLIVVDRVITGEEGDEDAGMELEVLSDSLSILVDAISYFVQQHGQDYIVERVNTLTPFTEVFNDRVAGHSVILQIKQFNNWDKCSIPETGASIPPTVDGLTLYDFCDQSVLDRLTSAQNTCLTTAFGGSCDPVTVQLNGATIATPASGDTYDVQVHDSAGNDKGTAANPSVISDSILNINGANEDVLTAEATLAIFVKMDGVESGTYDEPTKTVNLTGATCDSLAVSLADASPSFGDSVLITATPTGIAPDEYRFYIPQFDGSYQAVVQAGNTYSWTIGATGTLSVGVIACEGTDHVGNIVEATVASAFFSDLTLVAPVFLLSLNRYLHGGFIGSNVALIRRGSDSALQAFTPEELKGVVLSTWIGLSDAYLVTEYDHSGNGNDRTQPNTAYQGKIYISGVLQTDSNGNIVVVMPFNKGFVSANYGLASASGSFYCVTQSFQGLSFGNKTALIRAGNDSNLHHHPFAGVIIDDNPLTHLTSGSSGTPEYLVNGIDFDAAVPSSQFILQESITFMTKIDFTGHALWNTQFSEYVASDVGTIVSGEEALFDGDISGDVANLTTNSNDYYGYY